MFAFCHYARRSQKRWSDPEGSCHRSSICEAATALLREGKAVEVLVDVGSYLDARREMGFNPKGALPLRQAGHSGMCPEHLKEPNEVVQASDYDVSRTCSR